MAVRTPQLPLEKVSPQTTCSAAFVRQRAAEAQAPQRQLQDLRTGPLKPFQDRSAVRSGFMVRPKTSMTPKSGPAPCPASMRQTTEPEPAKARSSSPAKRCRSGNCDYKALGNRRYEDKSAHSTAFLMLESGAFISLSAHKVSGLFP